VCSNCGMYNSREVVKPKDTTSSKQRS
jgi:hypothetical protein